MSLEPSGLSHVRLLMSTFARNLSLAVADVAVRRVGKRSRSHRIVMPFSRRVRRGAQLHKGEDDCFPSGQGGALTYEEEGEGCLGAVLVGLSYRPA